MVKLRVAARVIPEDSYLASVEAPASTSTLLGEKRFPVIVRDPEDWYIGTLANEIKERYKSLYRHDIGQIKYLKDSEDDCDLDPSLLVYDLLIDEGKAASDGADQHVTIKVIQEQGRAVRIGSVIPDLTPVHYLPRSRPPVPKFSQLQPVLGKRASTKNPYERINDGSYGLKRARLAEIPQTQDEDEDVPMASVETDAQGYEHDGRDERAGGTLELVHESQMHFDADEPSTGNDSAWSDRERRQAGQAPRFSAEGFVSIDTGPTQQLRAGSTSRASSEYYSPAQNLAQEMANPNSAIRSSSATKLAPSIGDRKTLGRHYGLKQKAETPKGPITPPSDRSINGLLGAKKVPAPVTAKSKSPSLRTSSTSLRKFKIYNNRPLESDIEDSQMSPPSENTTTKQIAKSSSDFIRSPKSMRHKVPLREMISLMVSDARVLGDDERRPRGEIVYDFIENAPGLIDDEIDNVQNNDTDLIMPERRGTVVGAGNEELSDDDLPVDIPNEATRAANPAPPTMDVAASVRKADTANIVYPTLDRGTNVDSCKDNESQRLPIAGAGRDVQRGGKTVDRSQAISSNLSPTTSKAQEGATAALLNGKTNENMTLSRPLTAGGSTENHDTSSQSKKTKRRRSKKKSTVGDLSSLPDIQQDPIPARRISESPSVEKPNIRKTAKTFEPPFVLEVPKKKRLSGTETPMLDSPGEQLSGELQASSHRSTIVQNVIAPKDKPAPKKRKSAAQKEQGSLVKQDPVGENGLGESKTRPKANSTLSTEVVRAAAGPKTSKARRKTIAKGGEPAKPAPGQEVIDLVEPRGDAPKGSMGLGITNSPRKVKDAGNTQIRMPSLSDESDPGQSAAAKSTSLTDGSSMTAVIANPVKNKAVPRSQTSSLVDASTQKANSGQASAKNVKKKEKQRQDTLGGLSFNQILQKCGFANADSYYASKSNASKEQSPAIEKRNQSTDSVKEPKLVSRPEKSLPVASHSVGELASTKFPTPAPKVPAKKHALSAKSESTKSASKPLSTEPLSAKPTVITNPKINSLRAQLAANALSNPPFKPPTSVTQTIKKPLVGDEDDDEDESDSESASEDGRAPSAKKHAVTVAAIPDPSIRDKTPSSVEDEDDDEGVHEL